MGYLYCIRKNETVKSERFGKIALGMLLPKELDKWKLRRLDFLLRLIVIILLNNKLKYKQNCFIYQQCTFIYSHMQPLYVFVKYDRYILVENFYVPLIVINKSKVTSIETKKIVSLNSELQTNKMMDIFYLTNYEYQNSCQELNKLITYIKVKHHPLSINVTAEKSFINQRKNSRHETSKLHYSGITSFRRGTYIHTRHPVLMKLLILFHLSAFTYNASTCRMIKTNFA